MELSAPLKDILHTTKPYLDALESIGVGTVEDFLLYLPRTHEDLSQMQTIASSPLGEKVTIRGTVRDIKLVFTRSRKKLVTAHFTDSEGDSAEIIWFNQPHIKRMLREESDIALTGKLSENGRKLQFQSPQFEITGHTPLIHAGRLVPIYPEHDVLTTRWIREKMVLLKDSISLLPETLPKEVLQEEKLMGRSETFGTLHFPEKPQDVERARERLVFEQLFRMQSEALTRKKQWQGTRQDRLCTPMNPDLIRAFFTSLKFTPTASQKIAIYEILRDMEKDIPMSRLLEGDVGSGKTLVAAAVIAHTIATKGQCALMVPTEVLARQHAATITRLLLNFSQYLNLPPSVVLLTGSTPLSEKESIKQRLSTGQIDLVIGTHALIEEDVVFRNLLFTVIDEQHRFGVLQRENLRKKGNPHVLSMTATPIPRTLALTAYGDHDLSVLLEKPGNRRKIQTKVVGPKDRKTVERFIDVEIGEGRQVFVICPLIESREENSNITLSDQPLSLPRYNAPCHTECFYDSKNVSKCDRRVTRDDTKRTGCTHPDDVIREIKVRTEIPLPDLKSVETEIIRLQEIFPRRRIALLHGRMTPEEKEETMRLYKERAFDILVSTSVIEVGIDVPNATIIVIESAERFGLAQLHQFRGRVGRSDAESHCFLFTTNPTQKNSPRLKAMEKHDSGFLLAEIDLKLRGPGELLGTLQSGLTDAVRQSLFHPELVVRARRAAEKFLVSHRAPACRQGR